MTMQAEEWLNKNFLVDGMNRAFTNGEWHNALKFSEKILDLHKNDFDALCYKGTCLAKMSDFYEAIPILNECLKEHNDKMYLWSVRGDCYYGIGDYEWAFSDYWRALQLEPEDGATIDRCARALFLLGEYDFAIDCMEKAIVLSEDPTPFLVLAEMLTRLECRDFCLKVVKMGARAFPDDRRFDDFMKWRSDVKNK